MISRSLKYLMLNPTKPLNCRLLIVQSLGAGLGAGEAARMAPIFL